MTLGTGITGTRLREVPALALLAIAGALVGLAGRAAAQISDESPPPMMQWFECRWQDMERRMPDFFAAGWGRTWVPPVARGHVPPTQGDQNSTSAGYDPFDRFDLGKPGAQTAYGTEQSFDRVVDEFHRAGAEVYIDIVLNHNGAREGSAGFQTEGGYPGFWMAPAAPPVNKTSTSNWGDFHGGTAAGYYQSTNPSDPRYCLLTGDLVGLIDINHSVNNLYIRQPVAAGNPQNIPGGTYFNLPKPANARFYPDQALGTDVVNNPGMWFAGALNTGIFAPPCNVPARDEPASQLTRGRFNTADPAAGDPIAENASAYLSRWVQWMLEVHKVDGFRIDAIKHMPSWYYDTFFDAVVHNRRETPDGRFVTPYSFGESVEGNDFTFDRYIRKPNGRASGRLVAGDAFGNRDALDLNGAGQLRDVINGFSSWGTVQGTHLDNTDDGFNNGSIGVAHIFSHDNGSLGSGGAIPAGTYPTARQQGWFAHCYLLMRLGQAKVYHNARGIARSGGFSPREGVPVTLGWDPAAAALNPVITNLVQLSNWYGRGWYYPRTTDNEVMIFERATDLGGGVLSGNVLVGCNRSYQAGVTNYDQRTFNTAFPQGTKLVEMTGNWSNPAIPAGTISQTLTVGASGSVTIRVPRNVNIGGTIHNLGFVVYGPAVPSGTMTFTNVSSTLAPDAAGAPDYRQRLASIPVITNSTFRVQLTTTNGEPGAANNNNADDNALFRISAGFQDLNGNGSVDIPYTSTVAPGYEGFLTVRQPLAGTANTNGVYEQQIDAAQLDEGMNYVSVLAFRKRNAGEASLFREFRQTVYIDRLPPAATLVNPSPLPAGTVQHKFLAETSDRTVTRVHLILNPPTVGDPLTLATIFNQAVQDDRFDWSRNLTGLQNGANTVLLIAFEEAGRGMFEFHTVQVGAPPCGSADFDGDGDTGTDSDIEAFFACLGGNCCATCGSADFDGDGDTGTDNDIEAFFRVLGGGEC